MVFFWFQEFFWFAHQPIRVSQNSAVELISFHQAALNATDISNLINTMSAITSPIVAVRAAAAPASRCVREHTYHIFHIYFCMSGKSFGTLRWQRRTHFFFLDLNLRSVHLLYIPPESVPVTVRASVVQRYPERKRNAGALTSRTPLSSCRCYHAHTSHIHTGRSISARKVVGGEAVGYVTHPPPLLSLSSPASFYGLFEFFVSFELWKTLSCTSLCVCEH